MLRARDYDGALRAYTQVARSYSEAGFALKAIAVWKQMREVIKRWAPEQRGLDDEARTTLASLYRLVGLHDHAARLEAERTLH